jgi:molybdopterin converting factor small subunit
MALNVAIPGPLRAFTDGSGRVTLAAAPTVGEALAALWSRHPALRDRVLTEDGALRPHVNVFVGAESIKYTGGFSTPLADGAEIFILPAISGGRC